MDQRIIFQEEPRGPSVTVEVLVGANGIQRLPFPDVQQLRSTPDRVIILKSMRLITNDVLSNGILKAGVTAPLAELQKITLTLYCDGWEKMSNMPILPMNDTANPAGLIPFRYRQTNFDDWRAVSWDKSFLQWANGTVSATAPYVVLFDVQYIKLDLLGNEIKGPK
jgi:hypothetical protein